MRLSKQTVERLKFGAKLLRQHHDNGVRLDLARWFDSPPDGWCGTKACACGLFGSHKWFQMRGLFAGGSTGTKNTIELYDRDTGDLLGKHWVAVTKFFGIPARFAAFLFIEEAYRCFGMHYTGDAGALAVAKRIEALIAKGEVPRRYLNEYGPNTQADHDELIFR